MLSQILPHFVLVRIVDVRSIVHVEANDAHLNLRRPLTVSIGRNDGSVAGDTGERRTDDVYQNRPGACWVDAGPIVPPHMKNGAIESVFEVGFESACVGHRNRAA